MTGNHGLQALEDAFKTREPRLVGLKVEPIFDPLRADNRFTATIQTAAKVIRMVLAAPLGNRPRSGTDPGRNAWWKTRGSDITSCFTYRLTSNSSVEDCDNQRKLNIDSPAVDLLHIRHPTLSPAKRQRTSFATS